MSSNNSTNSNVICTICAERYRNSDNIHAGSCGHAFHEECLFRWRQQSRTCPICRSEDAAFFQLYLGFESDGAGGGGGGGQNQNQGHSSASNGNSSCSSGSNSNASSPSSSASSSASNRSSSSSSNSNSANNGGIMREYENLLYEKGLYQEEIEYLNECIVALTVRNSLLKFRVPDSDSDSDSD